MLCKRTSKDNTHIRCICLFSLYQWRLSSKYLPESRIFIDDEQTVFFLRRGKTLVGTIAHFALKAQRTIYITDQIIRILDSDRKTNEAI